MRGVRDTDHRIVGASFKPHQEKTRQQEPVSWLTQLSQPRAAFEIYEFVYEGLPVVLFQIPAAAYRPIRFSGEEFIRIGSYKVAFRPA